MVLATDSEDHRSSVRQRIPCCAVVDHCPCSRRFFAVAVCLPIARQGAVGRYRQIPRLLVEPFLGLHVLGDGRNVDRTPDPVNARRVYRRVCGQGKRDGCHDDAGSRP